MCLWQEWTEGEELCVCDKNGQEVRNYVFVTRMDKR